MTLQTQPIRHVIAISLLDHDRDRKENMHAMAAFCVGKHFESMRGSPNLWFGTGGRIDDRGLSVWRVTSVPDLAARLRHLDDAKLETLTVIGHGDPNELFVGTYDTSTDPEQIISPQTADVLAAALDGKFVAPADSGPFSEPQIRLVGCEIGGEKEGASEYALVSKLARGLSGVSVVAPKGRVRGFDPMGLDLRSADARTAPSPPTSSVLRVSVRPPQVQPPANWVGARCRGLCGTAGGAPRDCGCGGQDGVATEIGGPAPQAAQWLDALASIEAYDRAWVEMWNADQASPALSSGGALYYAGKVLLGRDGDDMTARFNYKSTSRAWPERGRWIPGEGVVVRPRYDLDWFVPFENTND